MDYSQLISKAVEASKKAYAPYSHFHVGAAVLVESGAVYAGCNVENASYGAAICAERNAITTAIANGERKLSAIALVGGMDGDFADYCSPCGICRQVMREFCDPAKFSVVLAKSPTDYKVLTLAQLLPESFGPESLG